MFQRASDVFRSRVVGAAAYRETLAVSALLTASLVLYALLAGLDPVFFSLATPMFFALWVLPLVPRAIMAVRDGVLRLPGCAEQTVPTFRLSSIAQITLLSGEQGAQLDIALKTRGCHRVVLYPISASPEDLFRFLQARIPEGIALRHITVSGRLSTLAFSA